jgi:purine-binding chemotaxis protein CheW
MQETVESKVKEGKYITFRLGKEEFGIKIEAIHQIIGITDITPIPHTPDYIKGVLNLRGRIIPVIDLRLKFSLEEREYDERTCIIIVEVNKGSIKMPIGIIVDFVSEVMTVTRENVEDTPYFGVNLDTAFIMGIAKLEDKIKIILDIDRVLTSEEINVLDKLENEE